MRRAQPEYQLQCAIADHLRLRAAPGVVWFHVPNGGWRSPREGRRLRDMGVLPGVSDIIAVHRGKMFCLELKTPGNRPTKAQESFISDMTAAGAYCCVCNDIDRALNVLKMWGLLR